MILSSQEAALFFSEIENHFENADRTTFTEP
jgi:hypothetical protein